MYIRMNSYHNERTSRTNYVRSSILHYTLSRMTCITLNTRFFLRRFNTWRMCILWYLLVSFINLTLFKHNLAVPHKYQLLSIINKLISTEFFILHFIHIVHQSASWLPHMNNPINTNKSNTSTLLYIKVLPMSVARYTHVCFKIVGRVFRERSTYCQSFRAISHTPYTWGSM